MNRILLLEDCREDAELTRRLLHSCDVTLAIDLVEFKTVLVSERFDCILADYSLPRASDYEALEVAKKLAPGTPFIYLSGLMSDESGVEAMKRGASDFLEKSRPLRLPLAIIEAIEKTRLKREILRAQRMDSIGLLASGLSHDLRNHLSPAVFVLAMIRNYLPEHQQKLIDQADLRLQKALELQNQVIAFVRGETGPSVLINILPLIEQTLLLARETPPKNCVLRIETRNGIPKILGEWTRLQQVFLNLLVNAQQAMSGGGEITVHVDCVTLHGANVQTSNEPVSGDFVRISIADQGEGIPGPVMARIFEPFYTTKKDGTGLGLSLSLEIIRSHQGYIDVSSIEGNGSTFIVLLPYQATLGSGSHEPMPPARGERILIVDDEESLLDLATIILGDNGYTVFRANSAAEAILVWQRERNIDLICTDLVMPGGMCGAALIERIRAAGDDCAIICMSGIEKVQDRIDRVKPDAVLRKPFVPSELLSLIRRLLDKRKEPK